MQKLLKKYRLKDGGIYWHRLYYDLMPSFLTKYSPPGGFYNYAAYAYKPHKYLKDLCLRAKWFLQRGTRGYSDCDVWNWNSHMARVNTAALRQLAKGKLGHPCGMTSKGWQSRLLRMADGFQAVVDEENDFTRYKSFAKRLKAVRARHARLRRGLTLYRDHFQSLWD